jgi:hypothetical protein
VPAGLYFPRALFCLPFPSKDRDACFDAPRLGPAPKPRGRAAPFEPSPKELPVERAKHRAAIKSVQIPLDLLVQPGAQLADLLSMSPDVGNDHTRGHVTGADRKVIHVPTSFTAARQRIYACVYPVGTDIKVGVAVTAPDFRATNWVRNR